MMPPWLINIMLSCLILVSAPAGFVAAPAGLTFVSGFGRETLLYRRFQIIYSDAFKRLNIPFTLISLPKDEALVGLNQGLFDGDSSRVLELEKHKGFPNLVRVDVIMNRSHNVAFTENGRLKVHSWEDIKSQNLTIGFPRGQIYATGKVKEFQLPAGRVLKGENCEQLLQWLDSGRIDLYVDNIGNCWEARRLQRFKDIRVAAVLSVDLNYPYLHTKHKNLIPKLTAALKASLADPAVHAQLAVLEQESMEKRGAMTLVQLYTPYDFEPFVIDRAMQNGLIYDVQRYLNALGDGVYHFAVQTPPRVPVERLEKMRELAIVPFVTQSWFDDENGRRFDWTLPLIEDENLIVSSKSRPVESLARDAIKGKIICGGSGLKRDPYLQQLINDGWVKQTLTSNTGQCLRMIARKRADFYASGRMLIDYYLHQPELSTELRASPSSLRPFTRRILITPKGGELLGWLNQRIEGMGKSQVWQTMMKSFHVQP
jgi:ABC-type amino acid transport substrate-binding protein